MTDRQFALAITLPMMWGDMDSQMHMNNVQFFKYCEQVRAEWLVKIGCPLVPTPNFGLLLVTTSLAYLKPISYPNDITVKLYVGPPGRSSFMTYYEFLVKDDPEILYAQGDGKIVCFNPSTQKSVPIPEHIKNNLFK